MGLAKNAPVRGMGGEGGGKKGKGRSQKEQAEPNYQCKLVLSSHRQHPCCVALIEGVYWTRLPTLAHLSFADLALGLERISVLVGFKGFRVRSWSMP